MRVLAAITRFLHAHNITTATHTLYNLGPRDCDPPYCEITNGTELWTTDCGLEHPTMEDFMKNRAELIRFFSRYYNDYVDDYNNDKLKEGEMTIVKHMVKRLAPDVSLSSVMCDGRSKCGVRIGHVVEAEAMSDCETDFELRQYWQKAVETGQANGLVHIRILLYPRPQSTHCLRSHK
jgi:hypothetical protein